MFFKHKTAYEMRISDWSSDVCSSDLIGQDLALDADALDPRGVGFARDRTDLLGERQRDGGARGRIEPDVGWLAIRVAGKHRRNEIGRASCRESVCPYVEISVVAVSLKKKLTNHSQS